MENKNSKKIFAENLKKQIYKSGKKIPQISKEINIAHSYLYELCNDNNKKMPTFKTIEKLASYFNIEVSDFFKKN